MSVKYPILLPVLLLLAGCILATGCTGTPPPVTGTPTPTVSATPTPTAGMQDCVSEGDCVPAQCCHPTGCINKAYKGVCTELCTNVCQGPIDCGAGSCRCVNGKCGVVPSSQIPNGTLAGNVSIGPLCPVEPCNISRDQVAAAYAARPITISTTGGSVVTTFTADPVTGYSVALQPGTYVVSIPRLGIGGSPDLPANVTILSGETIRLDISIDTGIR